MYELKNSMNAALFAAESRSKSTARLHTANGGYESETAENGKTVRLSNAFPPSRSSRAEDENDSNAIEMKPLPEAYTDSKYAEWKTSVESGSEGSEEATTDTSLEPVDPCVFYSQAEEAAVIRSFDRRLVLFIALLYMLSFLDRSNIGNAKIAGLSTDLKLDSSQYEWLLRAFYITYIAFEWMTLLYRVLPPHIYISICVASWGLVASVQSVVTSYSSLLVLRALLGVSEAAFGPGVPFYLSFFYRREELALRTGLFISAAPLATSFASSLAWAITKAGSSIPIAPWRILFLVEGFPSIIVAVFAWYYIPDSPGKAGYLNIRQRQVASIRLLVEHGDSKSDERNRGLCWTEIWDTLKNPKCYLTAAMFFCCNVSFSSLPVFLPTIIEQMGYSAVRSQALSAPPYLLAFLVVLLSAYLSDRHRDRSFFILFHALLAASGYAMIAVAGSLNASAAWRYAGVYPATMGFFSAITIIITWSLNNQDSASAKGTGIAMLNFIGQLGPLVGVNLYPESEGPYYVKGMTICAGFMAAVGVLAMGLRAVLAAKNRESRGVYSRVDLSDEQPGMDEDNEKKTLGFQYIL